MVKHLLMLLSGLLLFGALSLTPALAQESGLDALEILTPENVDQLDLLATFDELPVGSMALSANSQTFVVARLCLPEYSERCDIGFNWIYDMDAFLGEGSDAKPVVVRVQTGDSGLTVSPDGRYVGVCKETAVMTLVDVATETETDLDGHYCPIFNDDSSLFLDSWVSPDFGPPVPVLYDLATHERTELDTQNNWALGFVGDDRYMLGIRSEDFQQTAAVEIYELATNDFVVRHTINADYVRLNDEAGLLALVRRDRLYFNREVFEEDYLLYSLATAEERRIATREGLSVADQRWYTQIGFNPSGSLVSFGNTDDLRFYDTTTGEEVFALTPESELRRVIISERVVVMLTQDGVVQVWGVRS